MIVDSRSLQTLIHMKDRKEEISDIKFSPGERFGEVCWGNRHAYILCCSYETKH